MHANRTPNADRSRGSQRRLLLTGSFVAALTLSACSSGSSSSTTTASSVQSTSSSTSHSASTTSSPAGKGVAVTDTTGNQYKLNAGLVVRTTEVTDAEGDTQTAPSGQAYLTTTITVTNPTSSPESVGDFDFNQASTRLAQDLQLTINSTDASSFGVDPSSCGQGGLPANLCPVSSGGAVFVDSDSATIAVDNARGVGPGSSIRITLTAGPVSQSIEAGDVMVYFTGGPTSAQPVLIPQSG